MELHTKKNQRSPCVSTTEPVMYHLLVELTEYINPNLLSCLPFVIVHYNLFGEYNPCQFMEAEFNNDSAAVRLFTA